MLTRRFLSSTVAALALVAASGTAHATERSLLGVVLGRSYRQVLAKFGSPTQVQLVSIPVPGQGNAGTPDQSLPGGGPPGYGAPGSPAMPGYGGPPGGGSGGGPSYGAPAMSGGGSGGPAGSGGPSYGAPAGGPPGFGGGPPGGSGGGPPVLPPVGGAPGASGYGDNSGAGGQPGVLAANGAEWIYHRPGGVTMAFIINEDGLVAQISVSSQKPFPAARTSRGVTIGMDYKKVLETYGWPPQEVLGGYYVEAYYTKKQHASFTFVTGKLVRITIALAD